MGAKLIMGSESEDIIGGKSYKNLKYEWDFFEA
jgi:hypothetical protein